MKVVPYSILIFLAMACPPRFAFGITKIELLLGLSGGTSYYLGQHAHAKVRPNLSYSLEGAILFSGAHKIKAGMLVGADLDRFGIEAVSPYGALAYTRQMIFFRFAPVAMFAPSANERLQIIAGPDFRYLWKGSLLKKGYQSFGHSLSEEELNTTYFRKLSIGLRMNVLYRLGTYRKFDFCGGLHTSFSFASTDFQAQPGTLNQAQLSIILKRCVR